MNILSTLLVNSLVFSVLFGLILLVRKLFCARLSITCQYLLWGMVLLKLVLPFGFEAAILPAQVATKPTAPPVQQQVAAPAVQQPQPLAEQAQTPAPEMDFAQSPIQPVPAAQPAPRPVFSWASYVLAVWVLGMALMSLWLLWYHRQLHKRLQSSSVVVSSRVLALVKLCTQELGIKKRIRICMQSHIEVPAISGIFHTTLILPASLNDAQEQTVYNVCLHELMHYRCGDLYFILFLNLLNIVYWFHPLVWSAIRFVRDDMESMCDKRVLALIGSKDNYVATILKFATGKSNHRLKAALSMAGGGRVSLEERVRNMFRIKKTSKAARLAVGLLALVMLSASVLTACRPVGAESGATATDLAVPQTNNAALQQSLGIPERHQESYVLDNGTKVDMDAPVIWPGAPALVSANVRLQPLTQEQLDGALKTILGDAPLIERPQVTKQDVLRGIEHSKQDLQTAKSAEKSEFAHLNMSKEEYIAMMEQDLKRAEAEVDSYPDENAALPTTSQMKPFENDPERGVSLLAEAEHQGRKMTVDAYAFHDTLNSGMKIGVSMNRPLNAGRIEEYQITPLPTDVPYGINKRKAEAQKEAIELVGKISPDLKLTYTGIGVNWSGHTQDTWAMVFMREVDGVPTTFTHLDHGDRLELDAQGNPIDMQSHPYEKIVVHINDAGFQYFEWVDPYAVEPSAPANALPFEQVMLKAKEHFPASYWGKASKHEPNAQIIITEIRLGFVRATQPGGGFQLVPVWDFIGFKKSDVYAEGLSPEQVQELKNNLEEHNVSLEKSKSWSMLTLRATDGTPLDRGLGR